MGKWRSQQGTTSLAEYAVTLLLVMAAVSAIATYVQRTLQARTRDARHYMITTVSNACNANCMNATNLPGQTRIADEYEPYYTHVKSDIATARLDSKGLKGSTARAGTFFARTNSNNQNLSNL